MFALDTTRMRHSTPGQHTPPDALIQTSSTESTTPPVKSSPSTFAPDVPPLATSPGIPPVTVECPGLAKTFNVSDQQALVIQHDDLSLAMQRLHAQQPSFKAFEQQLLASLFPDQPHLDLADLTLKRWQKLSDGSIKTLSEEPLLDALRKKVEAQRNGSATRTDDDSTVQSGVYTRGTDEKPATQLRPQHSLDFLAQQISSQYHAALQKFWTTPRPTEHDPKVLDSPQNQLLALHKQQLSTLAALHVADGTLSPASKALIDAALQYPTLAEREKQFPEGARPGVYPITLDDGTERGALLAGAFLITKTDGSWATTPTWPKGKTLALDNSNGPVVLYTPSEGFEEFATPALARQTLAKRLDEGGLDADLLRQTLPLSLQNRAEPPTGDDLIRSVAPLDGDVLAEGIPWMLKRQQAEVETSLAQIPLSSDAIDAAADWSYLLDGGNALLARNNKLADKLQPEWLKNLKPLQAKMFNLLEQVQDESTQKLATLLEKIPSLGTFARTRMDEAIKKLYPNAEVNADQLMVQVHTKTHINNGRKTSSHTPYVKNTRVSLTDLALENPTAFPAGESATFTHTTFKLTLTDKQGKPVLGADGKPVVLDTEQLKALVNSADVGGEYSRLLKKELATDAVSGEAGDRRTAWKTSQADFIAKEAFLGALSPDAYKTEAKDDKTSKRGAQWVAAVLDHPDPSARPKVDGETIVTHALVQHGLPVQGVMVIGNGKDPERVLYTPNAPDGITFREVASQEALNALLDKNEWKLYTATRKSPIDKDDVAKAQEALKKNAIGLGSNPVAAVDIFVKTLKITGDTSTLTPITGNYQDELYQQHVKLLIDKANHQSVSSAEVAAQSAANKAQFGVEVALIFLDLLPVAGKGISTGIRLGKAGVTALRANAGVLPKLLKNPALGRAIYSDFATAGAGIPLVRTAPLRPVAKAPLRAIEPPTRVIPPRSPKISTGTQIGRQIPPTSVSRDLSAYAVPSTVIQGRPLRPDGTYNVGDNFYVRFTDSTGENKVYQIDSAFHARSGQVNIIDPHAPLTLPKGSRIKASLQSAGNGEWRLNELPGGRRGGARNQLAGQESTVLDHIYSGRFDLGSVPGMLGMVRRFFRNQMNTYYERHSSALMTRPTPQILSPNTAPGELLREQLKASNGLVLGERHDQAAVDALLIKQMPTLREAGVTTLLLENAPGIGLTPYSTSDVGMILPRPHNPNYLPNTPSRQAVFEAAEKNGIKVVGLERDGYTRHDYRSYSDGLNNSRHTNDRQKEFNYYAMNIINQIPEGEKWVAVVGRSHMSTSRGVPGLAEMTGAPGIGVYDSPRGSGSVARTATGPRPDPNARLGIDDIAGDYQIHQNVDEYLKPLPTP